MVRELFEGEDEGMQKKEIDFEFGVVFVIFVEELEEFGSDEDVFVFICGNVYLYLFGMFFKVLVIGCFIEEQIFNWMYIDEQCVKVVFV